MVTIIISLLIYKIIVSVNWEEDISFFVIRVSNYNIHNWHQIQKQMLLRI